MLDGGTNLTFLRYRQTTDPEEGPVVTSPGSLFGHDIANAM